MMFNSQFTIHNSQLKKIQIFDCEQRKAKTVVNCALCIVNCELEAI